MLSGLYFLVVKEGTAVIEGCLCLVVSSGDRVLSYFPEFQVILLRMKKAHGPQKA